MLRILLLQVIRLLALLLLLLTLLVLTLLMLRVMLRVRIIRFVIHLKNSFAYSTHTPREFARRNVTSRGQSEASAVDEFCTVTVLGFANLWPNDMVGFYTWGVSNTVSL